MEPEGVVRALERIDEALAPRGLVLDSHPTGRDSRAVCGGAELGRFDESEFLRDVEAAEAALDATVRRGLFAFEREVTYDVCDRFGTAEELLEEVATWGGYRIPQRLERAIRRAGAPFEVHETVVLRRFRSPGR